jgi:hypothetical protein
MTRTRTLQLALAIAAALMLLPVSVQAQYGRFLNRPAGNGPGSSRVIASYGNAGGANPAAPIQFDQDVNCPGCGVVGTVRFDYDTYTSTQTGARAGAGAALSGGFYQSAAWDLAPGHTLAWVQLVTATHAGRNNWGIPGNGMATFPDATRGNAAYPGTNTANPNPPNPPGRPTLGYQDLPDRFWAGGAQDWTATLALVCFVDAAQAGVPIQAFVLDSFTWGFSLAVANGNTDTANAPANWQAGAPNAFLTTLNNYYSGNAPPAPATMRATTTYNFQNGCDDCFVRAVPEPSSYAMLVAGLFLLGYWANRGRRTS